MIKQKVKVGNELKFVNQSLLTKKDDGTFHVVYNSDMTVDYDSEGAGDAQTEYDWAKSELESSDIEIKYHERGSAFATCTKAEWIAYQEALLHYATVDAVDGVDTYTVNDISDIYAYVDVDGRPVSPPNNSDEAYRLDRAKLLRDNAISSDLVSQGMSFQVRDTVDLNNIQDVIDGALFGGYLPTDTISFRLSDNSWVDVTYPQLQQVQQDYRLRKQSVYSAFKVWTETDMSEDFSI